MRKKIPDSQEDPMSKLTEAMKGRQCEFSFTAVTQEEVLKVVRSLKNSKSTGTDFIDTFVIKLISTSSNIMWCATGIHPRAPDVHIIHQ